jgi:hypothetical protein
MVRYITGALLMIIGVPLLVAALTMAYVTGGHTSADIYVHPNFFVAVRPHIVLSLVAAVTMLYGGARLMRTPRRKRPTA